MVRSNPQDFPAADDEPLSLGPCCICSRDERVRAIVMLHHQNAVPGRGWGCFQCELPQDGAIAVLCEPCLRCYQRDSVKLVEACRGYPTVDGREPIETTRSRPAHDHDLRKHPEVPA